MDEKTQTIGLSVGIDVNELYIKYNKHSNIRSFNDPRLHERNQNRSITDSNLDNIFVCKTCNGSGLMKINYNHQVRDENCQNCQAQGLLICKDGKHQPYFK